MEKFFATPAADVDANDVVAVVVVAVAVAVAGVVAAAAFRSSQEWPTMKTNSQGMLGHKGKQFATFLHIVRKLSFFDSSFTIHFRKISNLVLSQGTDLGTHQ